MPVINHQKVLNHSGGSIKGRKNLVKISPDATPPDLRVQPSGLSAVPFSRLKPQSFSLPRNAMNVVLDTKAVPEYGESVTNELAKLNFNSKGRRKKIDNIKLSL